MGRGASGLHKNQGGNSGSSSFSVVKSSDFAKLEGSEKQVKWASDIRDNFIRSYNESVDWINNSKSHLPEDDTTSSGSASPRTLRDYANHITGKSISSQWRSPDTYPNVKKIRDELKVARSNNDDHKVHDLHAQLRAVQNSNARKVFKEALSEAKKQTSASWWIDHRLR